MSELFGWLESHPTVLWSVTGASAIMFIASLALIPLVVIRIPSDYFAHTRRHRTPWGQHHPALRALLLVSKNLVGGVVLLAGIAMLVLPGQGILTMLLGLMLLDIPGKYRFERWLVRQPGVWNSIAWLRRRAGRDPLLPEGPKSGSEL